ncbi:hypothetical protein D3C73_1418300 [compost metagenome]
MRGDMGQNAVLRRDAPSGNHLRRFMKQPHNVIRRINHRIDADHRIADPVAERLIDGSFDPQRIIRRMIGLGPAAQSPLPA